MSHAVMQCETFNILLAITLSALKLEEKTSLREVWTEADTQIKVASKWIV